MVRREVGRGGDNRVGGEQRALPVAATNRLSPGAGRLAPAAAEAAVREGLDTDAVVDRDPAHAGTDLDPGDHDPHRHWEEHVATAGAVALDEVAGGDAAALDFDQHSPAPA